MNNNLILISAIPVILIAIIILFKDKDFGHKYRLAFKLFFSIVTIILSMYMYRGLIGAVIGLGSSVIALSMFDKDYGDRIILETIKIVVMQMLVGCAAYYANYNYIGLIIISLVLVFIVYYIFTHNGKASRTTGFIMNYIILVHMDINHAEYSNVFDVLFFSGLLVVLMYYFLNRETLFKNHSIFRTDIYSNVFNVKHFIESVDKDVEFSVFKLRYAVLTAIAITGGIFYMQYYSTNESIWVLISIVVMLVPDKQTSKKKIIDRVIGTIVGAIIFTAINRYIHIDIIIYISIVLAFYFACFPMGYQNNAMFITYISLTLHAMYSKQYTAYYLDKYRIGFTIIGAIVVLVIFMIDEKFKTDEKLKMEMLKELYISKDK